MAAGERIGAMSTEQIKEYAANTGKISSSVESMLKHDGWAIFMALYERRKSDIKDKSDYASFEDFKADRAAIDIVDSILETFKGYIQDAQDAATMLSGLSPEDTPKDRGIMLIEATEGGTSLEG